MKQYNLQTDRAIKAIVDERYPNSETPTAAEGDEMPDDDIQNSLGDTYTENHHYHQAPKKSVPTVASALMGAGLGGLAIAALMSWLTADKSPAPAPAEATGKAFVELFYKRSDGSYVPLDGAETPEGRDIEIKVE